MEEIQIRPEDLIKRSELVLQIYGGWPSFHDFEIVRICFDRDLQEDTSGPHISAFIHMWQVTGRTSDGRKFIHDKHNITELRMMNVHEYEFKGFNSQNVLADMEVWQEKDAGLTASCIYFHGIFGADLLVKCVTIEIGKIVPGIPPHSIYAREQEGA